MCHGCGKTIPQGYAMSFKWVTLEDGTWKMLGYHQYCYPSSPRKRSLLRMPFRWWNWPPTPTEIRLLIGVVLFLTGIYVGVGIGFIGN